MGEGKILSIQSDAIRAMIIEEGRLTGALQFLYMGEFTIAEPGHDTWQATLTLPISFPLIAG